LLFSLEFPAFSSSFGFSGFTMLITSSVVCLRC
jgi:hypothetical protein